MMLFFLFLHNIFFLVEKLENYTSGEPYVYHHHKVSFSFVIFQVLLANRLDGDNHFKYTAITVPLFVSLITLIGLSFGAKGGNHCKFCYKGFVMEYLMIILG